MKIDDDVPSDEQKQPAPDPEIPDELRSKLHRSHRPADFSPKNPDAKELRNKDGSPATPPPEEEAHEPIRDLTKFFKQLAAVLKGGTFYKYIIEQKDVKRGGEWIREERKVKVKVGIMVGADGLPYVTDPLTAAETHRVRALNYEGAPEMNPRLGDLTPEFAEWLYLNHTYDACVRYHARSTHIQAWAIARAN